METRRTSLTRKTSFLSGTSFLLVATRVYSNGLSYSPHSAHSRGDAMETHLMDTMHSMHANQGTFAV